jgi:hypothetical protein
MHAVEDGCVVYVPARDQVHFLNATAMCVLELCDGAHGVDTIRRELEALAGGELGFDLRSGILDQFEQAGIVTAHVTQDGS